MPASSVGVSCVFSWILPRIVGCNQRHEFCGRSSEELNSYQLCGTPISFIPCYLPYDTKPSRCLNRGASLSRIGAGHASCTMTLSVSCIRMSTRSSGDTSTNSSAARCVVYGKLIIIVGDDQKENTTDLVIFHCFMPRGPSNTQALTFSMRILCKYQSLRAYWWLYCRPLKGFCWVRFEVWSRGGLWHWSFYSYLGEQSWCSFKACAKHVSSSSPTCCMPLSRDTITVSFCPLSRIR